MRAMMTMLLACWTLAACERAQIIEPADGQAQAVTIYRDAWGVPHIYGKTDSDAAFGLAYAQAEDNFNQIELNFISAAGRSAELFGESALLEDWLVHAFDVPGLSQRDYETATPEIKALLDGYAAGLNFYLARNSHIQPRLLDKMEPWYPLALIRRMYYVGGFLGRLGFTTQERQAAFDAINGAPLKLAQREANPLNTLDRAGEGSNSWAANGPKIAGDGSYLFINPHLPAFGMGQVYEAHMISASGWNFTGYGRFGFPLPYVGFNENLGWASTDNNGDQEDAWIEHFDDAADPLGYRYGTSKRQAEHWTKEIRVRGQGVKKLSFLKTHHGPVVAERDGKFLSARLATFEDAGWLDQWYQMGRAQNLQEFTSAARALKMQFGNYMYADRAGNILFVYNGAFPKKDPRFNWNQPVDGSDPRSEWQGYHSFDEIPQVLNPASHYVQNTNTTPILTSNSADDPGAEDFPPYMVRDGDNARRRNATRILEARPQFDFETWEKESLDTTMIRWLEQKPIVMKAFELVSAEDQALGARLQPVISALAAWDGGANLGSIEATLYTEWYEMVFVRHGVAGFDDPEIVMSALEEAVERLIADWGDWQVPWGQVNRSQRPALDESGNPVFCDTCPSIATPGVHAWSGGSQIAWNSRRDGLKKRYKTGGNSYTAIVDFPKDPAQKVRAKSVHVFGASADPLSPHAVDQATLLAAKQYKPAWLYLDDVKANAVRAYHPGEERATN